MGAIKKLFILICSAALSFTVLAGCGEKDGRGETKNNKTFTVSVDDIASDMGAGWNLGNTLEANSGGTPGETKWGNPEASQEIIDMVADEGFSTIRIPVSYLSFIDDNNGYKIDDSWLDKIQEAVDYCCKKNLYVIINIHGDGYNTVDGGWLLVNSKDQEMIKAKYEAVWRQIAEKFKDYNEHLIFESMNEVFDGEYHDPIPEMYENLMDYNQIFVDTVRSTGSNNTHRWLLVPGWNTSIDYTCKGYGFELPEDKDNTAEENRIMLSVHCYDPWDYCGTENKKTYLWGEMGQQIVDINQANPKAKATWGEEEYIETQFQKLKTQFVDNGVPVIIGEYGCIDKSSSNAGIVREINLNRVYYNGYIAGTAASMGIIPVYWDNGYNGIYGFGLFNRNTLEQTQPEIIDSIVTAVKNKDPQAGKDVQMG